MFPKILRLWSIALLTMVLLAQAALADAFDWSSRGILTPVRNQGKGPFCWAFAATEALEANWKLRRGSQVNLAPQPIIDRLKVNGANQVEKALADLVKNGTTLEQNYPYISNVGAFRSGAMPY